MKPFFSRFWNENKGTALFLGLMLIFRSALADWNSVPTESMKPTIVEGDRIFVEKMAYDLRLPFTGISLYKRADPVLGEIVVFDSVAADTRLVKRLIGVPGDVVEMRDDKLTINGRPAAYTNRVDGDGFYTVTETIGTFSHRIRIDPSKYNPRRAFGPIAVPEGHYLVLGDNRDHSADSRWYGFIPRGEFVGRSGSVVLSFDPDNYFLPRRGRFFQSL
jgi:signal peptidase I